VLEDDSLSGYVKLTWSKQNNQLITGAWDGKILIWDIETSQIIKLLEMFETAVMDLEISYDGSRLAAIGRSGEIYVWNTEDWKREFILQGPNDGLLIANLSFSPDGNRIISAGVEINKIAAGETRYQIWDCHSQLLTKEWNLGGVTRSISFSPDGQFLASSAGQIWNLSSEELELNEEYFGGNVLWAQDNEFVIFSGNTVDFWGINP
jgi:WD40 repeat protein